MRSRGIEKSSFRPFRDGLWTTDYRAIHQPDVFKVLQANSRSRGGLAYDTLS